MSVVLRKMLELRYEIDLIIQFRRCDLHAPLNRTYHLKILMQMVETLMRECCDETFEDTKRERYKHR